MTSNGLALLAAESVFALVPWSSAVATLRHALHEGLDPSTQPVRTSTATENGELLTMPAEFGGMAGVKVLSVAPDNAAAGLPRIQASYILFDSETLTPRVVLDGAALTTLRTPALAAVAVDALAPATAHRLVVFGAGPQAEGHVHALRAVRPIDEVQIVARTPGSAAALVRRLAVAGVHAGVGVAADVAGADIVATATNARSPVFNGALVRDGAVVTAVGSHHPDQRELDSVLMRRAHVVVEDAVTAMREAGDIVIAVADGALRVEDLVPISDVIHGEPGAVVGSGRSAPFVFKSVGQGWQDLVVARAAYSAWLSGLGSGASW